MVRDYDVLPWVAFADLVVVAILDNILLCGPAADGKSRHQLPRVATSAPRSGRSFGLRWSSTASWRSPR